MPTLDRDARKGLETTVKKARKIAEAGARKIIDERLRVGDAKPPGGLSPAELELRVRLRAHGRQLGDQRDPRRETQTTARLAAECAYEHWHRMLFARFLAETELLIEPEHGVSISLEDCQGLAREQGADWLALASAYAVRMLPQIFQPDDPVLEVALPPETRSALEDELKKLPSEVFLADDSLGWVYQFWQADRKKEINDSEVKIGADELPAVTQLFTEDYMVLFLLHNTLGAWWAGKVLAAQPQLAATAASEDELRAACAVGEVDWTYLRFVRETAEGSAGDPWRPASGTFDDWPKLAKDLTVLDPCMGSGHFLVFALPILTAFRMAEEGLSRAAAADAVLRDNLFGLEIDPRCTQIAAFNLAFAAWRTIGYRPLPQMNLACSGLAIGVTKAEWLKLAEKPVTAAGPPAKLSPISIQTTLPAEVLEERVKNGLEALFDLFSKAPSLGSLINPRRVGPDIFSEGFHKLAPLLASILAADDAVETREMAVAAHGMSNAAEYLTRSYTLVATNVPFLGLSKQSDVLSDYVSTYYSDGRKDLSNAFCMQLCNLASSSGCVAFVSPVEWTYQRGYRDFRAHALASYRFLMIAALGRNAFDYGVRASPILSILVNGLKPYHAAVIDASEQRLLEKIETLISGPISRLDASEWALSSNQRLSLGKGVDTQAGGVLGDFAEARAGSYVGDAEQFERLFWEVCDFGATFEFLQSSVSKTISFGGRERAILWEREHGRMSRLVDAVKHLNHAAQNWRRGKPSWGRMGIALSLMGELPATIYTGEIYDKDCCAIVPKDEADLPALIALFLSGHFSQEIRKIDRSLKIDSPKTILSIPCDIDYWRGQAIEQKNDLLAEPAVISPNQWIFSGHPRKSSEPLDSGLGRLVGYQWPRQIGASFVGCPAIVEDGLEQYSDNDGIVCLTALKGEPPADKRLSSLLADAFGSNWSAAKLAKLLADVRYAGKQLEDWLRDGFFAQHCEMFHHRPFVWHIWDGRRDGFNALVNYHHLAASNGEGRRTLEKLIYSYLGDWIERQRYEQKNGVDGAEARLAAAVHLQAELERILRGEPPYDLFIRWKPLDEQPIGWEPDINDGVRLNIRPFMTARPLGARAKNACILRVTPKNIKWDCDRGKEPRREKADFPWFWSWDEQAQDFAGGDEFDGKRWNGLHYTTAFKQAARDRRRSAVEMEAKA